MYLSIKTFYLIMINCLVLINYFVRITQFLITLYDFFSTSLQSIFQQQNNQHHFLIQIYNL